MKATKQTGLRVPVDLYPKIVQAANRDGRTINSQLLYYVRQALEHEPDTKEPNAKPD